MYFVGIGAQRAGTSWLWRVLQSHPQVAYSPIKELHYFSSKYSQSLGVDYHRVAKQRLRMMLDGLDVKQVSARAALRVRMVAHWLTMETDEDYVEYFQRIHEYTGKRCWGEITPLYAVLARNGFANIAELFPDGRFFFVMRNPVDRVWSNANMRGSPPPDLDRFAEQEAVTLRTDYSRTLQELLSVVRRDRVHVMFYEDLTHFRRGPTHLDHLLRFLELEPGVVEPRVLVDTDGTAPLPPLERAARRKLARRYREVSAFARDFMGYVPENWEQDFEV